MSMSRRCDFFKAVNGKWYVRLGNFEYAHDAEDCTIYGPFDSEQAAEGELEHHSNPGCSCTDDSGTAPVPKDVEPPSRSCVVRINPYRFDFLR